MLRKDILKKVLAKLANIISPVSKFKEFEIPKSFLMSMQQKHITPEEIISTLKKGEQYGDRFGFIYVEYKDILISFYEGSTVLEQVQKIKKNAKKSAILDFKDIKKVEDLEAISKIKLAKEVRLYHTTTKNNLSSIMEKGLIPQVGKYTEMGHGKGSEKLVYFLDRPISKYHGEDTVVLELINPKNYYIYHYDGYGLQELGGLYDENIDLPMGVEEGDYFTYETIKPKDLKVVKF